MVAWSLSLCAPDSSEPAVSSLTTTFTKCRLHTSKHTRQQAVAAPPGRTMTACYKRAPRPQALITRSPQNISRPLEPDRQPSHSGAGGVTTRNLKKQHVHKRWGGTQRPHPGAQPPGIRHPALASHLGIIHLLTSCPPSEPAGILGTQAPLPLWTGGGERGRKKREGIAPNRRPSQKPPEFFCPPNNLPLSP